MKVKELIERLQQMDPELPVHFAYNYGDYWKSIVTQEVKELDHREVVWSNYHEMHTLPPEDGEHCEGVSAVVLV